MVQTARIPAAEVRFSSLSLADVGRVFRWNGRIFRAIYPQYQEEVSRLFSSGLVGELVKQGVFVPSRISEYELDGFPLVVEHDLIDVVSYPREWSYSMFKEASLLILRVNEIASRYGYQTKDCHAYNVLFLGEKPIYIDLGSMVPARPNSFVLLSLEQFLRSYYYPLKLWTLVGSGLAARVIQRPGYLLETEDYLRCRWFFFRWAIAARATIFIRKLHGMFIIEHIGSEGLRHRHPVWKILIATLIGRVLGRRYASIGRLRRQIGRAKRVLPRTIWSDYHDQFSKASLPPRFGEILERINSLEVSSVLEIGANQGLLGRALKRMRPEMLVISADADEIAVDKGFRASKDEALGVNWVVLNPFFSELHVPEETPSARFQSDVVIALALTHHLLLSQGLPLSWILDILSEYSRKYVFVEFMPLGLFDGNTAPPIPSWYTVEWFQQEFEAKFLLVECVQLESNRILFIGSKGTYSP